MRLSSFFRHCETDFFRIFLIVPPINLIFCNRMDVQKIPKRPPFTFFGTMRLTGNFKKISKKIGFFSIFSFCFLRAFVVSSCRKIGFRFRVFLSLRYGADLGCFRLVFQILPNLPTSLSYLTIFSYLTILLANKTGTSQVGAIS